MSNPADPTDTVPTSAGGGAAADPCSSLPAHGLAGEALRCVPMRRSVETPRPAANTPFNRSVGLPTAMTDAGDPCTRGAGLGWQESAPAFAASAIRQAHRPLRDRGCVGAYAIAFIGEEASVEMHATDLGSVRKVVLKGRLDTLGVARVENRFFSSTVSAGKPVLIDLSGVEFLASMGIGMLLSAARVLDRRMLPMVVFGAKPFVSLDWVAARRLVTIASSEREALALLRN